MERAQVVGAVVVDRLDRPTRLLTARRRRPADAAARWEFPGGKVEPGESPQDALVRELREELSVTVRVGDEVVHPDGAWPISARLELRLFLAEVVDGEVRLGPDHDAVRWVVAGELDSVGWLPADAAALPAVRRATSSTVLAAAWPLPRRLDLRDRLVAAYDTGRGYHDLVHLVEVLDRLGELDMADDPVVVLAAWFHDAVYDGSSGDEERSAQLAEDWLDGTAGIDGIDVAEVARLVRLTATHAPAVGDDRGAALCDADLGVLAAEPPRYAAYVAGVRRDFAHVDDAAFRAGRLAVLEELLGRTHLFSSEHARRHWEPAARRNLAAEIAVLRA